MINKKSFTRAKLTILAFIAVLFVINLAAYFYQINKVEALFDGAKFPCQSKDNNQAKIAAIVFYGDKGRSTQIRVERAVQLYKQNCIDKIFMVGGFREQKNYHGALWMLELAKKRGVPESDLDLGAGSYDSITNLREAFLLAKKYNIKTLLFISDPLHLFRLDYLSKGMQNNFQIYSINSQFAIDSFPYKWLRFNQEIVAFSLYFILPETILNEIISHFRN